jgi:hypothetical protein
MDEKPNTKGGGDIGRRLLQKMLMPIVATAASAAAAYAAKKAPEMIDERVAPKVRELMRGAGGAAHDLPGKARAAAGDAGDVAERLGERARSVAGSASRSVPGGGGNGNRTHRAVSTEELERRTQERAKHRSARRKASR